MDTLNKKEIKMLNKLGKDIRLSLDLNKTDLNNIGIPSRTNRLQAVKDMIEYLKIHDFDGQDSDSWIVDILNGEVTISALKYVIKNPGKYDDIGFIFKEPEKVGWGYYTKNKDRKEVK